MRVMPLTSIYVKPRNAVTCGEPSLMLNVQLAVRFAPVMHPSCIVMPPETGPAVQTGSGTALAGPLALVGCGAAGGRTVTPGQAAWSRVSSA